MTATAEALEARMREALALLEGDDAPGAAAVMSAAEQITRSLAGAALDGDQVVRLRQLHDLIAKRAETEHHALRRRLTQGGAAQHACAAYRSFLARPK